MKQLVEKLNYWPPSLLYHHIQLSEELKQHLNQTMTENYGQPGQEAITVAVNRLQQDV